MFDVGKSVETGSGLWLPGAGVGLEWSEVSLGMVRTSWNSILVMAEQLCAYTKPTGC